MHAKVQDMDKCKTAQTFDEQVSVQQIQLKAQKPRAITIVVIPKKDP